ncbi:hypothetical protein G9A89_016065 [Geosiphon pyriformis]|nr:hypothetical protein G9A89_016065 [Geosiphon pyriformis]
MCSKFIQFFGSIHGGQTNQVMTDFGLTSGYHVHDGLDQGEVFSPLLWQIFYDPLLCKVKRQESVCGYRLNSHFVSKNGYVESQAGLISFLAAETFVDDMIWIGTNRKESHQYLGIFLSTEGLFKPSLAKAHLDVKFFANLVLKKAISDKQFSYLVSSVLHPIQVQTEHKVASVICFANSVGVLGHLFAHRSHDLQVLCWHPNHPLSFPTHIGVGVSDNYLVTSEPMLFVFRIELLCSLASLGMVGMQTDAAIFFDGVDLGLGVVVSGLVSFTMVKLQAIALAFENLNACWFKVKEHSGVVVNECADALAVAASTSDLFLSSCLNEYYILAGGVAVSGNFRHFKVGSDSKVLVTSLHSDIDWRRFSLVWHPDMHMAAGFTGKRSASACTYFIKALYHWLSMAVRKRLYSRSYPSILCLFCGEVEFSDHVFSCGFDATICTQLLDMHAAI